MGTALVVYQVGTEGRGRQKKSSRAVIQKRIAKMAEMLIDGDGPAVIVQFASVTWEISERQAWTYLRRTYDFLRQNLEKRRDRLLVIHENKRRRLWEIAFAMIPREGIKAILAALEVLKDEAKLQGLYDGKGRFNTETDADLEELQRAAKELADTLDARRSEQGNAVGEHYNVEV